MTALLSNWEVLAFCLLAAGLAGFVVAVCYAASDRDQDL